MEVVSIRVDEQLKRRMERLGQVNWSEVIRTAISVKVQEEERRERRIVPESLMRAKALTDKLRRPSRGWSSVEEIRKWRNQRR
jgi:metal-responsive CopG/Arc/MetJ family transcriptional regulator